jgi:hypothetical protein
MGVAKDSNLVKNQTGLQSQMIAWMNVAIYMIDVTMIKI